RGLLHLVLFFLGGLGAGAAQALDPARRQARLLGDLAVLLLDDHLGRLVAVEAPERIGRHPAVRPAGCILIDPVKQHRFAVRAGSGFAGHFCWSFFSLVARTRWDSKSKKPGGFSAGLRIVQAVVQADCRLVAADLPVLRSGWTSNVTF